MDPPLERATPPAFQTVSKKTLPENSNLSNFTPALNMSLKEGIPLSYITSKPCEPNPATNTHLLAKASVIYNALNIIMLPNFPTTEETDLHNEKLKFMNNTFNADNTNQMLNKMNSMAVRYPLFNSAKLSLKQNYEDWDSTVGDPTKLQKLQGKILVQQQNLTTLYKILDSIEKYAEHLPLLALDENLNQLLHPYISGERVLESDHEKIKLFLENSLKEIDLSVPFLSPESMAYLRSVEPVSKQAIIKEAKLFEAERKGKVYAYSRDALTNENTSLNTVTKMSATDDVILTLTPAEAKKKLADLDNKWLLSKSPPDSPFIILTLKKDGEIHTRSFKECIGRPGYYLDAKKQKWSILDITINLEEIKLKHLNAEAFGYFKTGNKGEMATGFLEKLMWDISVVLGMEEQFVATKVTSLLTYPQMTAGSKTVHLFNADGHLTMATKAGKSIIGGFQPDQEGVSLYEIIQSPESFPGRPKRESVIQGTLTSLVFGMFDAHGLNILVDKDGNVKFFDNARSFPHSNSFINRGKNEIISPYFSEFLNLPVSFEALTKEEIKNLQSEINKYEGKMVDLKQFLSSPQAQKQIDQLPSDWLNTAEMLIALEVRIKNIKSTLASAVLNGNLLSLRGLCLGHSPEFKLNAALQIVDTASKIYDLDNWADLKDSELIFLQRTAFKWIGTQTLEELFKVCVEKGVDPLEIKKLCEDPTLNFDEVVQKILQHMADYGHSWFADPTAAKASADILYASILSKAKNDFKDLN